MKKSNYFFFLIGFLLSDLAAPTYAAPLSSPDSQKLAAGILNTVLTWEQIFKNSSVSFIYKTEAGENAVPFYQAKAIARARLRNAEPPADSINPDSILKWANREYAITVQTAGDREAVSIRDIRSKQPDIESYYRFDGEHHYLSKHTNRWDIVSSDVLPIATPADILLSLPNSIATIPMARSMLLSHNNLGIWIKDALANGRVNVSGYTVRMAGPADKDEKLKSLRNIIEFTIEPNTLHITSIREWKASDSEVENWRNYDPENYAIQEIKLGEYLDIAPGLYIPKKIEISYLSRWQSVLSVFPSDVRKEVVAFTKLPDNPIIIIPIKHEWIIEKIEMNPPVNSANFEVPKKKGIIIYSYLTNTYSEVE